MEIKNKNNSFVFLSDLHGNKEMANKISKYLLERTKNKNKDFDFIVLGGDFPNTSYFNYKSIVKEFLKINKPTIIMPGSYENSKNYYKIIKKFSKTNLIDSTDKKNLIINYSNNKLIFIPGSDSLSAVRKKFQGANFQLIDKPISKKEKEKIINDFIKRKHAKEVFLNVFSKIKTELKRKLKNNKDNKILFCHIPLKCRTKNGIDRARFGIVKKVFIINKKDLDNKTLKDFKKNEKIRKFNFFNGIVADGLIKLGYPIEIKEKNVGSKELKAIVKELNITKFFCGHIHEAGSKGIDAKERTLPQNIYHTKLFLNNGEARIGNFTIVHLKDNKISYNIKNIDKIINEN